MTQIVGDLFAGMNIGAVGSTVTLAAGAHHQREQRITTTTTVGSDAVAGIGSGWAPRMVGSYRQGSASTTTTSAISRPSDQYYNRYAETLYPLSDAYGFAYSDRIQGGTRLGRVGRDDSRDRPRHDRDHDPSGRGRVPTSRTAAGRVEAVRVSQHRRSTTTSRDASVPDGDARSSTAAPSRGGRARVAGSTRSRPRRPGRRPSAGFYLPPAQGDSHFYGRSPAECASTARAIPGFVLEDPAFMHLYLPVNGECPTDSTPVYRALQQSRRHQSPLRRRTQRRVRRCRCAAGWRRATARRP